MRSTGATTVAMSPRPARTVLLSVDDTEDMPMEAPELTLKASDRAKPVCKALARMEISLPAPESATSASSMPALTPDFISLTATVPEAAAAIRPKLAAAASTRESWLATASANTFKWPLARTSV